MVARTRALTWRHLVYLTDAELEQLDVALVHLLCTEGLPRTESLDIPVILAWIDQMTEAVQRLTEKLLPRLGSLSDEVRHSEAKFRMACLVSVLQRDFGITTDNRLNENPNFSDSRYLFLHGLFE